MTIIAKTIKYTDIKDKKRFIIEPSRRGTKKKTDPEQIRIFANRQKRITKLWRDMGIVSWKTIKKQ